MRGFAVSRRAFMARLALLNLLQSVGPQTKAVCNVSNDPPDQQALGLKTVGFEHLIGSITRNADFFVRNHFSPPRIDEQNWTLTIDGKVSRPLKLSYADLLRIAFREEIVTLECAGNPVGGGGVSTALWTGVALRELLDRVCVSPQAFEVVLHGADSGMSSEVPIETSYVRAIPLEKARQPATLLAYRMNHERLSAQHGFPIRAVVPGWYAMDSVKWLDRIEVRDEPTDEFFANERYNVLLDSGKRSPLTCVQVKSQIAWPLNGEIIRSKTYTVVGAAWAGEQKIARVEIQMNDDGHWRAATLGHASEPFVWTLWTYDWVIPGPGHYRLAVRATDESGLTQPRRRDSSRMDEYELHEIHSVQVSVETAPGS
jgi:DMSO/TMAO reductase YedYZ molybdopterin-dependent catalytic subunit